MLVNPLFDQTTNEDKPALKPAQGHTLVHHKGKTIQPISKDLRASTYTPVIPQVTANSPIKDPQSAAVEIIRQKVASLYDDEPNVKEELQAAASPVIQLSKHQQFMQALSTSGKPLAHIQSEWHAYYTALPDGEKHEVWREFYQANTRQPSAYTTYATQQHAAQAAKPANPVVSGIPDLVAPGAPKAIVGDYLPTLNYEARQKRRKQRSTKGKLKQQILEKVSVSAETQARAKEHAHSLLFGLGTGAIVLVIFLFGFFNEVFIAPFIQPSRHASATPIIVNADSVASSATPEVIIPKISVQIPTIFDEKSISEANVQSALERGVTHYPTTVFPGQQGNTAFFGHSSNNIFNKGRFKFAFVKLHELVPGDIFYLTYDKKVYAYKVFDKKIVPPSEVSVLNPVPGKVATATLITCDPPGTSTNRLVVWGEQISPDPSGAAAPTQAPIDQTATQLPSEGPTMWSRFWNSIF